MRFVFAAIASATVLRKDREVKIAEAGFGVIKILPSAENEAIFRLFLKDIGIVAVNMLKFIGSIDIKNKYAFILLSQFLSVNKTLYFLRSPLLAFLIYSVCHMFYNLQDMSVCKLTPL